MRATAKVLGNGVSHESQRNEDTALKFPTASHSQVLSYLGSQHEARQGLGSWDGRRRQPTVAVGPSCPVAEGKIAMSHFN